MGRRRESFEDRYRRFVRLEVLSRRNYTTKMKMILLVAISCALFFSASGQVQLQHTGQHVGPNQGSLTTGALESDSSDNQGVVPAGAHASPGEVTKEIYLGLKPKNLGEPAAHGEMKQLYAHEETSSCVVRAHGGLDCVQMHPFAEKVNEEPVDEEPEMKQLYAHEETSTCVVRAHGGLDCVQMHPFAEKVNEEPVDEEPEMKQLYAHEET